MKNKGQILLDYTLSIIFFTILILSINRNLILFVKLEKSFLSKKIEVYSSVNSLIRRIRIRDVGYLIKQKDIYISNHELKFSYNGEEVNIKCNEKGMYVNKKNILKGASCSFFRNNNVLFIKVKKGEIEFLRRVSL